MKIICVQNNENVSHQVFRITLRYKVADFILNSLLVSLLKTITSIIFILSIHWSRPTVKRVNDNKHDRCKERVLAAMIHFFVKEQSR